MNKNKFELSEPEQEKVGLQEASEARGKDVEKASEELVVMKKEQALEDREAIADSREFLEIGEDMDELQEELGILKEAAFKLRSGDISNKAYQLGEIGGAAQEKTFMQKFLNKFSPKKRELRREMESDIIDLRSIEQAITGMEEGLLLLESKKDDLQHQLESGA